MSGAEAAGGISQRLARPHREPEQADHLACTDAARIPVLSACMELHELGQAGGIRKSFAGASHLKRLHGALKANAPN